MEQRGDLESYTVTEECGPVQQSTSFGQRFRKLKTALKLSSILSSQNGARIAKQRPRARDLIQVGHSSFS